MTLHPNQVSSPWACNQFKVWKSIKCPFCGTPRKSTHWLYEKRVCLRKSVQEKQKGKPATNTRVELQWLLCTKWSSKFQSIHLDQGCNYGSSKKIQNQKKKRSFVHEPFRSCLHEPLLAVLLLVGMWTQCH